MESTKNVTNKADGPTTGQTINTASAATRAREEASNIKDKAGEVMDQTRQAVSNAYDKTTETLSNTYDQAVTYGRENPGTFALIAFGAGIGIGVLLASGLGGRSRMSRIAEPIVGALSQVAIEFLR
jgi:ElaB protein